MDKLPEALAEVVEPLREAEEYERLQEIRQKGLYNILTALPFPLLLTATFIPNWILSKVRGSSELPPSPALIIAMLVLPWVPFVIGCYPQMFLPLVRRYRPDWKSPLLASALLKKALEKLFWNQLFLWLVAIAVIAVTLLLSVPGLTSVSPSTWPPHAARLLAALEYSLLVGSALFLARQARKMGDGWLANGFLMWIPLGLLGFLPSGSLQFPNFVFGTLFLLALTTPPFLVGLYRLFASRRWLLH